MWSIVSSTEAVGSTHSQDPCSPACLPGWTLGLAPNNTQKQAEKRKGGEDTTVAGRGWTRQESNRAAWVVEYTQ